MRILIADDESTSRLLLKAIVSKLGHECLVAEEGSSAWDLLTSGGIDVLLTDWMMPGVDGPDLCRRVREGTGDSYVYIVLTTGLDHPEHVLEGMSAGADDYLIKPVDSFAVQTRLIAAERVTELHGKLSETQAELETANTELLERSLTDGLTASATAGAWRRISSARMLGLAGSGGRTDSPCSTSTTSSSTTTTTATWLATRRSGTSPRASTSSFVRGSAPTATAARSSCSSCPTSAPAIPCSPPVSGSVRPS